MKRLGCMALAAALSFSLLAPTGAFAAGAAETGKYRNLFVENGKTEAQVQDKIDAMWKQLFYGDDSNQRVFYPVGTDMGYIKDVANGDVRSEGMSYGMMVCVQLNKQEEFNRIWKWAKTYMLNPSGQFQGMFSWQCKTTGEVMDHTPASDGDEYFAMSLLFASKRWGDSGAVNYNKEAQDLLDAMLHNADDGNGVNMFDLSQNLVVFDPIGDAAKFTDPSYNLPAFYELWALWDKDDKDKATWKKIIDSTRAYFHKATNSTTGLSADYSNFDGSPKEVSWSSGHGDFRYDAWRTASNISVDYAWWQKDSWQPTFADTIQSFFIKQGIGSYGNQFSVTGTKLSSDHSPGLVAMNAVTGLASDSKSKAFIDELWSTSIPSGQYRYYDGMLYMLGMLHVTGNFKIYGLNTSTPTPTTMYGDVNGDKKVNSTDYSLVKRYLLGTETNLDLKAADVSGDGKVNSTDLSYIKRYILSTIDKFPAG
ncbi:MAG TPA: glycosyl hydrolase family 8 [Clostridia bacterium]